MNTYEAKQEAQRARLEAAADRADDPDAIQKLQAKIDKARATQDTMKNVNKIIRAFRKAGVYNENSGEMWDRYLSKMRDLIPRISTETAEGLLQKDIIGFGFAPYQLTANSENILRMEKRIKQLRAAHAAGVNA